MPGRNFRELLEKKWDEGKFLCVGLDTDLEKIPDSAQKDSTRATMVAFNRAIVDATKDIVCAYKPNSAFYEARGDEGFAALRETTQYILDQAPDVPVILDAKRADIGSTNKGYVDSIFHYLQMDAVTVHPYLGSEALKPFLERKDKGIFVLCRTSNGGARELQDLMTDGEPLYKKVAHLVREKWNTNGNCGVVVGATYPEELREVRKIVSDMPILIPGVGAQGGDLEKAVQAGKDSRGKGMIIAAARSVIFASPGADFAEAARAEASRLHGVISKALVK
ncbi:orotidine-5'-phosphate decarboxylase [Candidatus Parcubacteria bacterium]|nr:MAG: orotidine-5'-phosphate decarboxylase [Candidatus Parcubacteria bacterium]